MLREKIVLAVVVMLAIAVSAAAGGDKMAKLKAELNLTDQQVAQLEQKTDTLKPLLDRVYALKSDLKALKESSSPDPKAVSAKEEELMAAKKEYHSKWEAALKSVATPEQWTKYESMEAEHKKPESAKKQ
jgi:hypothetical protein